MGCLPETFLYLELCVHQCFIQITHWLYSAVWNRITTSLFQTCWFVADDSKPSRHVINCISLGSLYWIRHDYWRVVIMWSVVDECIFTYLYKLEVRHRTAWMLYAVSLLGTSPAGIRLGRGNTVHPSEWRTREPPPWRLCPAWRQFRE